MTSLIKVLGILIVLALAACSTPQITSGSFSSNAGATFQDGQIVPEIKTTFELKFSTKPADEVVLNTDGSQLQNEGETANVAPLLDLIGLTEGTDKGEGYNETLSYGAYTGGDVDLTSMTLAEIDVLQTSMLAHPANTWNSSAIGRYQIVRTTLRALKKKLELEDDLNFTAELQDQLALELLNGRGFDAWKAERIDDQQFMLNLSKEWASLPNPQTGKGFYSGQNAAATVAKVKAVLDEIR
ncbi:hypothetical protein [Aestuariivita sp.]|uniref:hypothetical protein n=1 Tax=Aestuariivita sp. TaxID=1872407 RepID=UPI0021714C6E|nr:hypothetical protein [Aestuariivita sp.]MCE8005974.1 glycoside hydrolase family 104 protein [Aestuariivita sp.]